MSLEPALDEPVKARAEFSLNNSYLQEEGIILLTGIQALVRLPLDQHRADKRQGLSTATLISGYRGSPLGSFDLALQKARKLLAEHQVVFIPGVNEDLGATAIFGSQLANRLPTPRYDGVLGMWYGKAPGVDRSGDAFKHANFTGVGRYGGVLAVAGDDPVAKSSTIPSHSEAALYDAKMPILYPGTVQEILDLGRLGFELSRYTGCWVGFKIVTDVADGFATVEVSPDRILIRDPGFFYNGAPWRPSQNSTLLTPFSLYLERELVEGRLEAAKWFAAANGINRITVPTPDAWLGIVAAGKTYYDVREALQQLGLDDERLHRYGIRLLKIGMLYPLEPGIINTFARGLEEIFVIEEKRSFIELFLRDVLYNQADRPRVVGKQNEHEDFLVPAHGELDADKIAPLLAQRLARRIPLESVDAGLCDVARTQAVQPPITLSPLPPAAARTPYFCSGCPHSRSLRMPEGSLVGAGIGCHTMLLLMDQDNVTGITHMGGEGAQWVGAAPFSGVPHSFQNLGDGTLFHSGTLAIRQAVAANANITYKILYNAAVAMTGGQAAEGGLSVPALTRLLEVEGVKRTIVVSADVAQYPRDARWGSGVEIWERERLEEAQQFLRKTPGVTALIYDQECAANLRRKRRRGQVPDPPLRVFINEAVCEGCGDCGVKSNCLSVVPVETEFGRKTQIHQYSCNRDYTCLQGDCPSFITVIPEIVSHAARRNSPVDYGLLEQELPDPQRKVSSTCNIYMMGIGGTGVVTANQILGVAALLDGKHVCGLDQTGLSQKGGPVVSNLKILDRPRDLSNKVTAGEADVYLVFDLLTGTTDANLSRARPDRTFAVVSTSCVPTGAMVRSTEVRYPDAEWLTERIEAHTRAEERVYLDANRLAEELFDSQMPANLLVVGAAYEAGLLPIAADSIERAIGVNGVEVELNRLAFRVGRRLIAHPEWASSLDGPRKAGSEAQEAELTPQAQALIDQVGALGELKRLLEIRVPELIAYQDLRYAREYVEFVKRVFDAESRLLDSQAALHPGARAAARLSEAVARYLFNLMAYKDEYEVARLHLMPAVSEEVARQFGEGARIRYQLQPPLLRAWGLRRKIGFRSWFRTVFRLLVWMRRLRGSALDIFGYTHMRRVEHALIGEYRAVVEQALALLDPQTYETVVQLAELPDLVRGYEEVKLKNVERFRGQVQILQQQLEDVASAHRGV
jgi:indolepyruvate ferredoxin oxidoreductase